MANLQLDTKPLLSPLHAHILNVASNFGDSVTMRNIVIILFLMIPLILYGQGNKYQVSGFVFDSVQDFHVQNAKITMGLDNGLVLSTTSDENGEYRFEIKTDSSFNKLIISAQGDKISTTRIKLSISDFKNYNLTQNIHAEPSLICSDSFSPYISFNQSNAQLDIDNIKELNEFVQTLDENQDFKLLIKGYSSYRESDYISFERKQNVYDFLTKKIKNPEQLILSDVNDNPRLLYRYLNGCDYYFLKELPPDTLTKEYFDRFDNKDLKEKEINLTQTVDFELIR